MPQDPERLFGLMGGRGVARRRLGRFFTKLNAGPMSPYAFLGNEPTLGTPWLYDRLGRPELAGAVVHRALRSLYSPAAGGMPGNDDGGTLSSWVVLAALGVYPEDPSTGVLELSAPLFPHVHISLPAGTLIIDAPGTARAVPATLDGRVLSAPRVRLPPLVRGTHQLTFAERSTPRGMRLRARVTRRRR